MNLPHQLERTVTIRAPKHIVFSFFTDSARWATWWGAGSTIDPRPGGRVHIVHPNQVVVGGEIVDIRPPESIIFTYGYESDGPIPAGGSRVTIRLEDVEAGTRLRLTHEFEDATSRDHHVQGWRYQLALFSNAVLAALHAGAEGQVDAWLNLWSDSDAGSRQRTIAGVTTADVRFADRFSLTETQDDLAAHMTAVHRFMPGVRLERRGPIRQCQGTVLADWAAVRADGSPVGSGTTVFTLAADGRIAAVTGLWKG